MSNKNGFLQVIRAIAALLVVFSHAWGNWVTRFSLPVDDWMIHGAGKVGVYVFFFISGYIIWPQATGHRPQATGHRPQATGHRPQATGHRPLYSARTFFMKRLVRIVPLYWIFTSLYAIKLLVQHKNVSTTDFLKSIAFIPYTNADGHMMPVHQLGWTLNYEMYFYVLVGISIAFFANASKRFVFVLACLLAMLVLDVPFYGSAVTLIFAFGSFLRLRGAVIPNLRSGQFFGGLEFLGDASYSIYLIHPFVLGAMNYWLLRIQEANDLVAAAYLMSALVFSSAAGVIAYIYCEKPLTNWIRKRLGLQ